MEVAEQYKERFIRELESAFGGTDRNLECPAELGEQMLSTVRTRALPGVVVQARCDHGAYEKNNASPKDDRSMTQIASLEELMRIRDCLIDNAGFTPAEYRRIKATFLRYDCNNDGVLNQREMRLALTWLGADVEYAVEVTEKASVEIGEDEFVQIIKDFFHREEDRIHVAFEQCDKNDDGLLERSQLPAFFQELGHFSAMHEVIDEALGACGMSKREVVNFEDIYQVFMRYRERNGFMEAELEEIHAAFVQLDVDNSGTMDAAELETAVIWLGFPSTFAAVRDVLELYDIDESGEVELDEITGFVARYRDQHVAQVRRVFAKYAGNLANGMAVNFLRNALYELLFMPTKVRLTSMTADLKELSLQQFQKIATSCRREVAAKARQNECFSDMEVRQFRVKFAEYAGETGEIATSHLSNLLEELYPSIRTDLETHARARRLLEAADENGDGVLEFSEFLRMMRLFRYEVRSQQMAREKAAIQETGFSKEEVQEFHKVFDMFDMDASGDLEPDEFENMILQLVPVTKQASHKMLDTIRAVGMDGSRELGFPEFLKIMGALVADTPALMPPTPASAQSRTE